MRNKMIMPNEEIAEKYLDGSTIKQLAKEYVVSNNVIRRVLTETGTETRPKTNEHQIISLDQEKVVLLYRESQSVTGVAEIFNVSKTVINRVLKEANEPKRVVTKMGAKLSKECIGCGTVFIDRPGKIATKKYCTTECANLNKNIHNRVPAYAKAAASLSWNLKQLGWTIERLQALNYAQGGLCYLCGQTEYMRGLNRRLGADHNHETMEPRGLLCNPCNAVVVPMAETGLMDIPIVNQYLAMFNNKGDN